MDPQDPPLGKIIDRIQKLVALARGGGTEAEAEQAMRLVHALLAQHNLSLEPVLASRPEEKAMDRALETEDAANNPWERPVRHATVQRRHRCRNGGTAILRNLPLLASSFSSSEKEHGR